MEMVLVSTPPPPRRCVFPGGFALRTHGQVDCVDDASSVELIFMECEADFGDINFYFGGEDFALTVRRQPPFLLRQRYCSSWSEAAFSSLLSAVRINFLLHLFANPPRCLPLFSFLCLSAWEDGFMYRLACSLRSLEIGGVFPNRVELQ